MMPLPEERIMYLLEAFTSKTATQQEEDELMQWVEEARENSELKDYMQKLWNGYQPGTDFNQVDWETMYQNIMQKEKVYSIAPKRRSFAWTRVAAAVAFLMVLSIGGYFLLRPGKQEAPIATVAHDVKPPKINKATITLAGGQMIILDSAGNGTLATQNNISIIKKEDGEITYIGSPGSSPSAEVGYNTLTNPKGSKVISLALSDGSKVWLNAESSLTYPTAFSGKERKVQVTGEAYFEVRHDPAKPFIVSNGAVQVQVLGTHFNVNAYSDEEDIKVTLLEGSVKVSNGRTSGLLKPGQQAVITDYSQLTTHNDVDLDAMMAWKNGYFNFDREPVTGIMKELSRWYDAEVVYEGPKPEDLFSGIINRDNNVSQVLKMLEQTKRVHFRIEDHKVIVTR